MDQPSLESILADLHLPAIRYFPSIGSTNDAAMHWIDAGARHRSLVIADEQTAGRGRFNRRWVTIPKAGLAFSLILLSPPLDSQVITRLTGLGAVAVCNALDRVYSLPAQIKWPNDVLLDGSKAAGVLAEVCWSGQMLRAAVIGIGINIAPQSMAAVNLPPPELSFPVTCLEHALHHKVDRLEILHAILQEIFAWLPRLASPQFIEEWESRLAFRDCWVELSAETQADPALLKSDAQQQTITGKLIGLAEDGRIKLRTSSGALVTAGIGEIHLRPLFDGYGLPSQD